MLDLTHTQVPNVHETNRSAGELLRLFDRLPLDNNPRLQQQLDIARRSRTSLFPWRGQFSPEFIEFMLGRYAPGGGVVVDPFVGSGTTLFEAARKGLDCIGVEINPAAAIMAGSIGFVNLNRAERLDIIASALTLCERHLPVQYTEGLFVVLNEGQEKVRPNVEMGLQAIIEEALKEPALYNLVANTVLRFMELPVQGAADFHRVLRAYTRIIEQLPSSTGRYQVFHTDARSLPIADHEIDLVVTSPPYINVFNYHQNHRRAMEMLGWDALEVARSEFGSNRKHRSNRFLTVIQYALDMLEALREMRRVLKPEGLAILVVGRESNIRGVPFQNGRIVAALAEGGAGLVLNLRQERKFKNKFGAVICEDILHFVPGGNVSQHAELTARNIALHALDEALQRAEGDPHVDIMSAVERISNVQASPIFTQKRHTH